jgi:hypothetical protein
MIKEGVSMDKSSCSNCGNRKNFYREVSVMAKQKVTSDREDSKTVYAVKKEITDNYFEPIYCVDCDEIVES